jgi:hypothetical protein
MTPSSSPLSGRTSPQPRARRRRVKRGIVAGYIHDISPRHRAAAPAPVVTATPVAVREAAAPVTAARFAR